MALNVGIVGLPNAGKSTIFNALTACQVPAENFPFCTIDPSTGVVTVPDPRLDKLTQIYKPAKITPTAVEFVDIAGLVKNASQGEGLGNKFLSHIREVDAIAHVVRCFEDPNVVHVHGKVDPKEDIEVINMELALTDLDATTKRLEKEEKLLKTGSKETAKKVELLKKVKIQLEKGLAARKLSFTEEENVLLKEFNLLTAKPMLYVGNISEGGEQGENAKRVAILAKEDGSEAVFLCGKLEAELAQLQGEEKTEFLKALGIKEPGLDRLIRSGYHLLRLITYFTAGPKEVRAWTITQGTKAPQAAGKIHSDFEKGFIRAEVFHYNDLVAAGSESQVKAAGKYRSEGKEYVFQDGDIVLFRFNV
ncbi:MAG: redox-regulated ATPase YchF [Deltaproteobacteria bacterium RIFCSPLOWO2_01_44_7]|nr:MAG: redox-regulated ATPase YchF [Deltaproteobacteria bacterium RIFCSPHIGHO2_01_FULL_43_49]OGQ14798.1 MAG: redox-regulated ATPase YchF [Deltaproteobacteria bacterium RIFCSPHIGHO2_02_FULL_44_53]OGQ28184.1 MAG: redox-regulated ATPase YchF [Deltaproteobacteria bacterium RIFCSPHIGHO2_12_FULL_44_21]OGQ31396.1 MAG: redox-regulated ATPase YchF [Deltaproteobacteria bacterium RIFCSPLOWO2_01_FULL_45_74]OGQ39592.1 MAG: redox-regulated ATPase YchF [Deltaproteobacteria bacterium RIFCSPLOWO2_01_44_7]OGQ4